MPWKDRLKARFGKKEPPTSSHVEAPPTSTPHARTAPDPATSLPSLPARLWNQAYDQAKTGDPGTVDAYEKILTIQLSEKDAPAPHSADLASQQNQIAQDAGERWMQMQQLVQNGLRRTEKDAKVKQGVEEGIQAAMAVKEVVDKAIQASPEAAVAWVGVCFALEILMNPLTQASSNRQGIAYVVSRMEWYWNLADLLLEENMTEGRSSGLREELEKAVTLLYAKLLLYQMKSVCYYHRGRLSVFARDLIKLDNWDGELGDIEAAEAVVQKDSAQYNTLAIRTRLGAIAEAAKSQNAKLDGISLAIREQTKQQERIHETSVNNQCLADLFLTDPRADKKRIEETKGGLLKDSYCWILDNPDFRKWRYNLQNQLLWVKADPGKGKTMLLCGIIDELQNLTSATGLLTYFFCQATNSRINNATAVLRGLLYMLAKQQPSLVSHIRKKYDSAGKGLFEGANTWFALTDIFISILEDPNLKCMYLIVDALDECISDLPRLLDLIIRTSSLSSRIKWLLSSRNELHIEQKLKSISAQARLSLELKQNAKQVAHAVDAYIDRKLACIDSLEDTTLRSQVREVLRQKANGTFLWVALVVQELEKPESWNPLEVVEEVPVGLHQLYDRMVDQIQQLTKKNSDRCRLLLSTVSVAYRPLYLAELGSLCKLSGQVSTLTKNTKTLVAMCGSFLTILDDQVYLIHQSAKDYLSDEARAAVFRQQGEVHYDVFSQSLRLLSGTLKRDIYSLDALGCMIDEVTMPVPDPLGATRYSCIYWIDHLCDSIISKSTGRDKDVQDGGAIHAFLKAHYLYWLEALSLCKSMSQGVVSITKLEDLVQRTKDASALIELVQDARRFIMSHKWVIENCPLQTYASALLFSPTCSLIRCLFKREELNWITTKPAMEDKWSPCLQTLEGHSGWVSSVAFSHNSARLASASYDKMVKIWDASSGTCLQTLEGHSDPVNSVAFSYDSARLASASSDKTIKIWDASSGVCLQTLDGHKHEVNSVAFSHDSARVASASSDETVKIWDASNGVCLQTLDNHGPVFSAAFSPGLAQVALASDNSIVTIWDASSGACLQTLEGHSDWATSVAFSPGSAQVASASNNGTVKIWDVYSGACLQTLKGHNNLVRSVAFSHDSARLASASYDRTVKIWDASSGTCLQTLKGHSDWAMSVAFSPNSAQVVSASFDKTVKIWDVSSGTCLQTKGHSDPVNLVAFSHDLARVASVSDETIKIWDASSGKCMQTLLKDIRCGVSSIAFSHDLAQVAAALELDIVKIWDASSGACLQTLEGHSGFIYSVAFSHDSAWVASASRDTTVKIWDASSGACLQTLEGHSSFIYSVAFSHNSTQVASASQDKTIKIWDVSSGACLQTLEGHGDRVKLVAFSHDSAWVASASGDKTVKIWDASSGDCLWTLTIGRVIYQISFDITGSYLHTNIGAINICALLGVPAPLTISEPYSPQYEGLALSADALWITYNSENLVLLPSEYRPRRKAVSGNTISIGTGSGRVWICKAEIDIS
ncbi:hypothetical protein GJ744_000489 [Endocarpon pusillum]|uniref:NACHT domain-containing protein n=1 Tax=Endocarpon pusillum TaxID=364733 RepID=A0A8H7E2I1_9EURO|nr:hypothetical protein GJ744_000489 [Endocarpon pusillum]